MFQTGLKTGDLDLDLQCQIGLASNLQIFVLNFEIDLFGILILH